MKAEGRTDANVGGGSLCPVGMHTFMWRQASYKRREEPSEKGTVGSLMLVAECVESNDESAVGTSVVTFINHNRDMDGQAQQISEQTLADFLANTMSSNGKSLHDELQERFPQVDYWFTKEVIEQIVVRLPELHFKAKVRHGRLPDGTKRAEFARISPITAATAQSSAELASEVTDW